MKQAGIVILLWLAVVPSAKTQVNSPEPQGQSPVPVAVAASAEKSAPATKRAPVATKPQSAPPASSGKFSTAIEDNSFFLEEAINQEAGIVQHISNFIFSRGEGFHYVFTQEWPVPNQTHQLSLTLPISSLRGPPRENGFGDILLNYRFGALQSDTVNIAPRVSLVLPSGSNDRGLGDGSAGVQFNLPVSHRFHENWVYHLNAGATFLPRARALTATGPVRRNINAVNLGGSMIWLARPNFNAMLETFAEIGESIDSAGLVSRDTEVFMSPGVRWAINVGDLQIVPGFAVPFRLNNGASARGVFFYLSFEHPFGRSKTPKP